jgi:hypothetical protein
MHKLNGRLTEGQLRRFDEGLAFLLDVHDVLHPDVETEANSTQSEVDA